MIQAQRCFVRGLAATTAAVALGALATAGARSVSAQALAAPAADSTARARGTAASGLVVPAYNERPTVDMRRVRLTGHGYNVLRTGPGSDYAIVRAYPEGAEFTALATSGAWYGVRLSDTQTGWVHASLCEEASDLASLQFRPNLRLYSRKGSYVLSGYSGAYAFDRKSNSVLLGGRAGYYVFDRIVAEAGVGYTHVRRPAEIVGPFPALTTEPEDFPMLYYQANLVLELLPDRQMVPYLGAGVGWSLLLGRNEPAVNYGSGVKLFLSRRAALRWEARVYRFRGHTRADDAPNNNLEFTLGSEFLF